MRRILKLINEVSLLAIIAALLLVIMAFGFGYAAVQASGWGSLEFSYETDSTPGLLDALYFSIVTISSLGYGDIRPEGLARLLAGSEVALGLAFFGIIVAKVSSVKQDYILRRLYYADLIDRRLRGYVEQLEEYRKLYRITSTMLLDGDIDPELTTTFCSDVPETTLFFQVQTLLSEIRDLIQFEIHNGGFFGDVSDASVSAIYANIQGMMRHTARLMERDPEQTYTHVLCGNESLSIELLNVAVELALLGKKNARNPEIVEQCQSLLTLERELRPALEAQLGRTPPA